MSSPNEMKKLDRRESKVERERRKIWENEGKTNFSGETEEIKTYLISHTCCKTLALFLLEIRRMP